MSPVERLILNVDDHEAARYTRRRVLETAGSVVRAASSGQQALQML